MRNLLKGYLTTRNKDFVTTVKGERQKSLTSCMPTNYDLPDLKKLAAAVYNNFVVYGERTSDKKIKIEIQTEATYDGRIFLSLLTLTIQDL